MAGRRPRARTDSAPPRSPRGAGRGRPTRRALARGGTGPARRFNDALAEWSGVRITPMFGRWGYFVGGRLFACFPVKSRERDLWVRLPLDLQGRALAQEGVRPHRRFGRQGWIEMEIETPRDVDQALGWLRRAHAAALDRAATAPAGEDEPA